MMEGQERTGWCESKEGVAAVRKIERRPDVTSALKRQSVHGELKNQLMHISERAMGARMPDEIAIAAEQS